MRVFAVDWSGAKSRWSSFVAAAEIVDGQLSFLSSVETPTHLVDQLIARVADGMPTVVGIDFAFGIERRRSPSRQRPYPRTRQLTGADLHRPR